MEFVSLSCLTSLPDSISFSSSRFLYIIGILADSNRWRVPAPVGIYNLGNTCFMTAILHCLIHCVPLQRYFIRDVGHNHAACTLLRGRMKGVPNRSSTSTASAQARVKSDKVCLACEMDRLFLRYFGSAIGLDMQAAVNTVSPQSDVTPTGSIAVESTEKKLFLKGEPLVPAEMLTAAWKCGGMNHLAGYEQRDAHEFLHGFLETLGKHIRQFRLLVGTTINTARPSNCVVKETGVIHGKRE